MTDKKDALAKVEGPAALARPDFVIEGDFAPEDKIETTDIRLPRLLLAQGTSDEIKPGNPKYIPGVKQGDIFSNLLHSNFGAGPVEVVIVRREPPRAMEFWPRKGKPGYVEGKKGIKERSVPIDDPRCLFDKDGNPPKATIFHEYVAFDVKTREPFILSFKTTSTGAAKAINTLLSMRRTAGLPDFTLTFKINSALKPFAEGDAYVFVAQPGSPVDKDTFDHAAKLYVNFKGREVNVDEVEEHADETAAPTTAGADEDVPF